MVDGITWKKNTRFSSYLEDCWTCAGELLAVNAIGKQLTYLPKYKLGTDPLAVGSVLLIHVSQASRVFCVCFSPTTGGCSEGLGAFFFY